MSSSFQFVSRLLLALFPVLASASSVTVTASVTSQGSLFHYDYTIANGTAADAFLVDIPVAPNPSSIQNLMAPAGFQTAFDSTLGLVSFLEDTAMFSATPLSGFSFDSSLAPLPASFTASLLDPHTGTIYTVSGPVLAPVPEPSYFVLLTALALLALATRKRLANSKA